MKAAAITLIVILFATLILWIREEAAPFQIAKVFPFLGGDRPGLYDLGGLVMIIIVIMGLRRVCRRGRR